MDEPGFVLIERLKKQAKKLRKELGMKHVQALEKLSRDEGFDSWKQVCESNGIKASLKNESSTHDG